MKIGIDIDEVVVEFMKDYLEFHNQKKGTEYKYENIFTYRFEDFSKLPKEEVRELVLSFSGGEKFDNLEFVKDAKENIFKLEKKNKIFFITSRHPITKQSTLDFFERNFPKNNFTIHFSGENWEGSKSKGEICLEFGVDLIIEDNEDYALECAEKGIKTFLIDRPWNQNCVGHENITKVKDWEELMVYLDEILEEENGK